MTSTLLHRRTPTQAALAWQFTGQSFPEWPAWVQSCCTLSRGDCGQLELLHKRRSGSQIVYVGEWLVKDLDGEVCSYTGDELGRTFEPAA